MNSPTPDAAEIHRRLESDAFLYPPMGPFLAPSLDPAQLMRTVLARCEMFSGRTTSSYDSLQSWLAGIMRRNDVAFYGAALTDPAHAKDVDLLVFPSSNLPLFYRKPDFIHMYEGLDERVSGAASIFLAGPLLFPDMPEISLLRRIEAERKVFECLPFFKGGLGELVTYAAYKAAETGEAARYGDFPKGFRFRLERKWFDGANMRTVVHTPHELNEQIREQIRELREPEAYALAVAAVKRLRAKESAQPALVSRFLSELAAKR